MHPERVYLVCRQAGAVACLRAVLPEPTYAHVAHVVLEGRCSKLLRFLEPRQPGFNLTLSMSGLF